MFSMLLSSLQRVSVVSAGLHKQVMESSVERITKKAPAIIYVDFVNTRLYLNTNLIYAYRRYFRP